jgi:hypothetical protein
MWVVQVEVARFMKLSGSTVEEFSVRVPRTRVRATRRTKSEEQRTK